MESRGDGTAAEVKNFHWTLVRATLPRRTRALEPLPASDVEVRGSRDHSDTDSDTLAKYSSQPRSTRLEMSPNLEDASWR